MTANVEIIKNCLGYQPYVNNIEKNNQQSEQVDKMEIFSAKKVINKFA